MPLLHGRRGAGLGNEVIPWAKAFIGAQVLGLRCIHPPWGLNPRGYSRDFGTSRLDALVTPALLAALPRVRVTPDLVLATGEADYADALRVLAPELGLDRNGPLAVSHESMEGGWIAIRSAREFIRAELLRPPHVPADLYRISREIEPDTLKVAVHLRFGDFASSNSGPVPGTHNVRLPAAWYESAVEAVLERFAGRAVVHLVTDEPEQPAVTRLLSRDNVRLLPHRRRPVLSDVLFMADADLLVCSTSAFSQLGAFLSDAPYVWFAPQLGEDGGWLSIWGDAPVEAQPAADLEVTGRGFALAEGDPLPAGLVEALEVRLRHAQTRHDLVHYGVVRRT